MSYPTNFDSMSLGERNAYFAEAARKYRENATIGARSVHVERNSGGGARGTEVATVAEAPRPLRRELSLAEPFPIDALGGVVGAAARAIVDKIQCPDALAANSVLAAASLATQAHGDVVLPATGHARPLSLFLVSVAGSGERKSAADAEALLSIRKREKALREQFETDVIDYRRAKRAYDAALAKAEKTNADVAAIRDAIEHVGDEPLPPLLPILTTDEPTVEGLAKLFEKGHPSLGLTSDEGGSFLGGHALNQENRLRTMAALSNIWDGAPIRRIRAGDGASILLGRRLALHLMLQPNASARLLSDPVAADQGLLSRLLVCAPQSRAGTRFQKEVVPETEPAFRRYGARVLDLLEMPQPIMAGMRNALEPRSLTFESNTAARWRRLCDAIETKLGTGGELEPIRGFANKLPEHIARIAGVLALIDNPDARIIGDDALVRAAKLGHYYSQEALRLFEAGHASPELREAERLLEWLRTGWSEPLIGLRAIYQRGPNSIRDSATAKRAILILEEHGWLVRCDGGACVVAGQFVREAWRIVQEG